MDAVDLVGFFLSFFKKKSLFFDMQIEVSRPKTQLAAKPVLSIEEEIQQVTDSIKIDL